MHLPIIASNTIKLILNIIYFEKFMFNLKTELKRKEYVNALKF